MSGSEHILSSSGVPTQNIYEASKDFDWESYVPEELKTDISSLVDSQPDSLPVLRSLIYYYNKDDVSKKRKVASPSPEVEVEDTNVEPSTYNLESFTIDIKEPIDSARVIELVSSMSFMAPIRKKLDLVFHVITEGVPALSIVNPSTKIPEMTLLNLKQSIKYCVLLPMLGNSTLSDKRNTGLLCFWINDNATESLNNQPIVCQFNLDLVKKQFISKKKITAEQEEKLLLNNSLDLTNGIKPINDEIIKYFENQFTLCGIELNNYLPSPKLSKNHCMKNTDTGIAVSTQANGKNDLVIVEAYKGSKDGSLVLIGNKPNEPGYLIFGFRKPILFYRLDKLINVSYSNITRLTFSILVTFGSENSLAKETIEFAMIDQEHFNIIDEFMSSQKIENDSFNEDLREKATNPTENTNENDKDDSNDNNADQQQAADSDDEEQDGTYTGGVEEEEGSEDEDSEDDEEYASNAEESDNASEESGDEEEES